MERFVIIVNGWKPLTIVTKRSILDVTAVLDPPLIITTNLEYGLPQELTSNLKIRILRNEKFLAVSKLSADPI